MCEIDTVVADDGDTERFKTAFYRFLEINPAPSSHTAWLKVAQGEPVRAVLWSRKAADAFRIFLTDYRLHRQQTLRFVRFDDLRH
jgi:hypothetical protein